MKRKTIITLLLSLIISMMTVIPAEAGWKKDSKGWWYQNNDGSYPTDEFMRIDGDYYYFDSNGYMVTGWMEYYGNPVYFKENGAQARSEWIGNKWLNFYGFLGYNEWVDNGRYYVNSQGEWVPSMGTRKTKWVKDAKGWKYDNGAGNYYFSGMFEIDGEMYFFDEYYMVTGWFNIAAQYETYRYYFGNDGRMRHDEWYNDYWFNEIGEMETNAWVDNGKYYVGSDGKWVPGYGIKGWKKDANGWKYDLNGYGDFVRDEFRTVNNETYYFTFDGYMVTGWRDILGDWYFFKSDGAMKKSAWEGNYWLKYDGVMAVNEWVDNGKYFVGPDGKWVPGKKHGGWEHDGKGWKYDETGSGDYIKSNFRLINGQTYAFNGQGYMTTGWVYFAGSWFFFKTDGTMKKNAWEGDYWLGSDGIMATNAWVDGGKYYVGADGKWVPKP